MTYSIIQSITNSYDKIRDCKDTTANECILFTDNYNTTAKNWTIHKLKANKLYPFDDIFDIRWNPFKFTNTDYVIWIDGSIAIHGSLKQYIDEFANSDCEFATVVHPHRNNVKDEYCEWCKIRNYDKTRAFMWLAYMKEHNLQIDESGLYQTGFNIYKNTPAIKQFCEAMRNELHIFDKEHYERLDQTVATFLLKTRFKHIKVHEFTEDIYIKGKLLSYHWQHPNR